MKKNKKSIFLSIAYTFMIFLKPPPKPFTFFYWSKKVDFPEQWRICRIPQLQKLIDNIAKNYIQRKFFKLPVYQQKIFAVLIIDIKSQKFSEGTPLNFLIIIFRYFLKVQLLHIKKLLIIIFFKSWNFKNQPD